MSKSSIFSPSPTNLTGTLVTDLTDKTAPPLASPSNFVTTSPLMFKSSSKLLATLIISCPVMASTVKRISSGLARSFKTANSFINSSSILKRPAVSIKTVS